MTNDLNIAEMMESPSPLVVVVVVGCFVALSLPLPLSTSALALTPQSSRILITRLGLVISPARQNSSCSSLQNQPRSQPHIRMCGGMGEE